jgi:hypothetical protein
MNEKLEQPHEILFDKVFDTLKDFIFTLFKKQPQPKALPLGAVMLPPVGA